LQGSLKVEGPAWNIRKPQGPFCKTSTAGVGVDRYVDGLTWARLIWAVRSGWSGGRRREAVGTAGAAALAADLANEARKRAPGLGFAREKPYAELERRRS
jgi:hypothetical protein